MPITEEQRLLRDALHGYLRDRAQGADVWRGLAHDLGVAGALLPASVGGMAGDAGDAVVMMTAFGSALVLEPVLETWVMAAALGPYAEQPLVAALLRRIVAGEARLAWALGEAQARFEPHTVATRARATQTGYCLDGTKTVVFGAPEATDLIVLARIAGDERAAGGLCAFLVAPGTPGVTMRAYRAIDGSAVANVTFADVPLAAGALIGREGAAASLIDEALALGLLGSCAAMAGVLRTMIDLTVAHVRDRRQFGQPLAKFQALRHHLVECWALAEQVDGILAGAVRCMASEPAERDAALSATKVFVSEACRTIGRYAIQFHGAMGITDEAPVSGYFKHATVLETRFGSGDHHLGRTVAADRIPLRDPMLGADDAAWHDEVRAFLAAELTPDLRRRLDAQAGFICEPDLHRDWQAILRKRGWDVPAWPVEHGGTGWSARQRYIFQSELAAAGAPFGAGMGINLCAPVIIAFGSDAQKAQFLPRIRSGEDYWAQGFSEPGSGSDLASLQLRARTDRDDYVIDGSKIWTTHAHHANWIFLLARTTVEERKQAGLSFILCPLDLPGITVRPIMSMSGEREVNQVFFDAVRVPRANRVGEDGAGWEMARYLLGFERGGRPFGAGLWRRIDTVRAMAAIEADGSGGRLIDDPAFRRRLALAEIHLAAADWTERTKRLTPEGLSLADASLLKLLASERTQDVQELTMDTLGPYAVADQRGALEPDAHDSVIGPEHALGATARYLNGRAYTIFGGASEIQRDILARAALQLD